MARNLGSISVGLTQANRIDWSYFVRVDIAAPIGTKRFTDRFDASGAYTGNIDGAGSLAWTEIGLTVGPLDQSDQDPLSVSWVQFWNLDLQFTTWANSPGLRNAPVQVWVAWFNTDGSLAGSYEAYAGKVDNQELGDVAMLALKPFETAFAREVPWVNGMNLGAATIMPKPGTLIQWGDTLIRGA